MFAAPILADDETRRLAHAAGWSDADIDWECLQERAANDATQATACWQHALTLARQYFSPDDPRLGTSLANAAFVLPAAQVGEQDILYQRAVAVWAVAPLWIDGIKASPRGRSSLHHLRLRQKNKQIYEIMEKRDMQNKAAEAHLRLRNKTLIATAEWQREKPPIFDHRRRLFAACFLMLPDHIQSDNT